MKRVFVVILAVILCGLPHGRLWAQASRDILFRLTFDDTLKPANYKGDPAVKREGKAVYKPGRFGKALTVGEGFARLTCKAGTSKHDPNLNLRRGAISFWFKAVNWEPGEKRSHLFYRTNRIAINRIFTDAHGNLVFETGTDIDQKIAVRGSLASFKKGQWIHVVAAWNIREIRLYINGKLVDREECEDRFLSHGVKSDFIIGDIPRGMGRESARRTLIDDFTIYGRVVTPGEIWDGKSAASAGASLQYQPPLVSIPKALEAPQIDGVYNSSEWAHGAELTNFANVSDFRLASIQTKARIAWDGRKIYIVVRSPVLPGIPLKADCKKRDQNVWNDDAIQVYLTDPSGDRFHFVGNSAGVIFDRKYTSGIKDDIHWNGKWKFANTVADGVWTAEVGISFEDLEHKSPAEGETWRLNVTRDRVSPRNLSAWPVLSEYADTNRHAYLVFRSEGVVVTEAPSFEEVLGVRAKLKARLLCVGFSARSVDVRWQASAAGSSLLEKSRVYNLDPGRQKSTGISASLDMPADMFAYSVIDKKIGKVVYRTMAMFTEREALTVKLYPVPNKGICKISIKANDSGIAKMNPKAFVNIIPSGRHTPVASLKAGTLSRGRAGCEFPISDLETGLYDVCVELKAAGSTVLKKSVTFEKPKDPWRGTKAGLSDFPPPPWTPIEVSTKGDSELTVKCWNRTHVFNGGPLPSVIDNGGEKILAGPISIKTVVDGAEQTLKSGKLKLKSVDRNKVSFDVLLSSRKLTARGKTYMEYDGMLWTEITIKPRGKGVVDSLDLVVPIKGKYAKYRHWPGRVHLTGNLGRKNGWRWSYKLPKRAFFWLGNDDLGLTWFFETWSQFDHADAKNIVELVRKDGVLYIIIHYVGKPVTLKKPLTLSFGLQATPTRSRPRGWRSWGGGNIIDKNLDVSWTRERFHAYGAGYPQAANPDYYYRFIKNGREKGFAQIPYCVINWHGINSPELKYHQADWDLGGGINKYSDSRKFWWGLRICNAASSYADFFVWKARTFIEKNGLDGIYHDLQWSYTCANSNHGSGEAHRAIRGDREINKRLYTMMKQIGRPLWKWDHASNHVCSVTSPFSDVFTSGEEMCGGGGGKQPNHKVKSNYFYNMRLDYFKACGATGRQWGVTPMFLIQMTGSSPGYTEALYSILFAHDAVPVWEAHMKDIRYMRSVMRTLKGFNIGADDVEFLPYWHQTTPAKVTFTPDGGGPLRPFQVKYEIPKESKLLPEEAVGASVYCRKGKRSLVVVFNYTRDDGVAVVKIDVDKLGLKGKRVLATDAFTRNTWVRADRRISLPVKSLNYRLIWVEELEEYDFKRAVIKGKFPPMAEDVMLAGYRPNYPEKRAHGFEVVGDLRMSPWSGGADSYTGPQRSELAQTFTVKSATKVHRVEVCLNDREGAHTFRKPVRIAIAKLNDDGLPGVRVAGFTDFAPIYISHGSWRYVHFEIYTPVKLEPGRYALVFSKQPEAPEEFYHTRAPSLASSKMPGEYICRRESPARAGENYGWKKVPERIIPFGLFGYKSPN